MLMPRKVKHRKQMKQVPLQRRIDFLLFDALSLEKIFVYALNRKSFLVSAADAVRKH